MKGQCLCRFAAGSMPPPLFDASIPVFLRYLDRLSGLVRTAEEWTQAQHGSPQTLLAARLAPDMLPFERQVVIAINFTLRASYPLAGEPIPPYSEFPETFAGLHARADRAVKLLKALEPAQFLGAESRIVESQAGEALVQLPGSEFLFQYALPNFFFHVTAAYAVLRSQGVPLGKADYDGFHAYTRKP